MVGCCSYASRFHPLRDIYPIGLEVEDAAWYYPEPKEKAIKDHIAFGESPRCGVVPEMDAKIFLDKDKVNVQLDLRGSKTIPIGAEAG